MQSEIDLKLQSMLACCVAATSFALVGCRESSDAGSLDKSRFSVASQDERMRVDLSDGFTVEVSDHFNSKAVKVLPSSDHGAMVGHWSPDGTFSLMVEVSKEEHISIDVLIDSSGKVQVTHESLAGGLGLTSTVPKE